MISIKVSMLGIAFKAGKVVMGTAACEKALVHKKIELLILHSSLSMRSQKHFKELCEKNKIDMIMTNEEIGKAIGKEYIKILGITDKGFKKAILNVEAY